jgi:hypothetical protein
MAFSNAMSEDVKRTIIFMNMFEIQIKTNVNFLSTFDTFIRNGEFVLSLCNGNICQT